MGSLPMSQLHFLGDRITTTLYEGTMTTQMVRYDSVDGKSFFCSFLFWFHGCSNLTQMYFPSTLSPKVYDGDSYLTSLGRMVTA